LEDGVGHRFPPDMERIQIKIGFTTSVPDQSPWDMGKLEIISFQPK
jgi:hypothetical protein